MLVEEKMARDLFERIQDLPPGSRSDAVRVNLASVLAQHLGHIDGMFVKDSIARSGSFYTRYVGVVTEVLAMCAAMCAGADVRKPAHGVDAVLTFAHKVVALEAKGSSTLRKGQHMFMRFLKTQLRNRRSGPQVLVVGEFRPHDDGTIDFRGAVGPYGKVRSRWHRSKQFASLTDSFSLCFDPDNPEHVWNLTGRTDRMLSFDELVEEFVLLGY